MEATRKRKSPVPENEEQKRARMDKRNEGDRYRRKAETEEERKARLEKRRERDRAKRRGEFNSDKKKRNLNEIVEDKEIILEHERTLKRQCHAAETLENRAARYKPGNY